MEIHGSKTTYNLENVLRQNILTSDYFKETCMNLASFEDVVDEIYLNVKHVEPWMSGNARGASTAFCLLYRLFLFKLDSEQIQELLDHGDSPYIRAIGFLYLRYVGDPKELWDWYEPYFPDEQAFSPSPTGMSLTMGSFVLDIMLSHYYFETIFPRVPKKSLDFMSVELKSRGLRTEAKGNGGCGGADRRGVDEPNRRPASVKASLSVAFSQRAPNRSNVREDGRVRDSFNQKLKNHEREKRERRERRSESRSPERRVRRSDAYDVAKKRERSRSRERARLADRHRYERQQRSPDRRGPRDKRPREPQPPPPPRFPPLQPTVTSDEDVLVTRARSKEADTRDVRDVFKDRAPSGPPRQILY